MIDVEPNLRLRELRHDWIAHVDHIQAYGPRKEMPFQLFKKLQADMSEWMNATNRFRKLVRRNPELKEKLDRKMEELALSKDEKLKRIYLTDEELLEHLRETVSSQADYTLVLYASETGNAEYLAGSVVHYIRRRGFDVRIIAMDDFDFHDLPVQKRAIFVAVTCGQYMHPLVPRKIVRRFCQYQNPKIMRI
eukprot:905173_1